MSRRTSWWKVLGAAGLAGVAATGVLAARGERSRRAMTAEEVRTRLHQRYAELGDPVARGADPRPAPDWS
ncbi:hypothetical protein [Arsenicicoccus dermatophilus]|uniref:hypothetical protein n=1 Tax=Arsenicicoccus dermatophilus TaxID=1076331 RepID=UPI001F4C6001|nr:hypothetical protein [Arsenicicoccus dermatophilus]MCH8611636.1 hypothetical protein [Arsenicicoccus dermatophilus]